MVNKDSIVPASGIVEVTNVHSKDAEDGAMANIEYVDNILQSEDEFSKFFHEGGWKLLAVSLDTWAPKARLASQIGTLKIILNSRAWDCLKSFIEEKGMVVEPYKEGTTGSLRLLTWWRDSFEGQTERLMK